MKKRLTLAALSVCAAGCLIAGACGGSPQTQPPEPTKEPVSLNSGFENAGEEFLFEGSTGVTVSRNEAPAFVNTGHASLKLSVKNAPTPKFSFSDLVVEKDISEYEYLSFWVYLDGDSPVSLSNTVNDGDYQGTIVLNRYYIHEAIQPRTWTKIKIEKGNAFFDNMMYYLPYGKFVLCGKGENFNAPMTYDFYIDDVRVFKKGMTGETEILALDAETEETLESLPSGAVGARYELPKLIVLGADGSELYGERPEIRVTDADGNPVELEENGFTTFRAGEYTLTARYEKDGFIGKYEGKFGVRFVTAEKENTELALIGERYALPAISLKNPANGESLEDATVTQEVFNESGEAVTVTEGAFTPDRAGRYVVRYTVRKTENGAENEAAFEKSVWASGVKGLVSDFTSAGSAALFAAVSDSANISFAQSDLYAKYQAHDTAYSLSCDIGGESFPSFRFGESFPYGNMADSGVEYISFWIYNGGISDLCIVSSGDMLTRQTLAAESWTRVTFRATSFAEGFDWHENEFSLFGAEDAAERITATLYFDDLRVHRAGDAEEADFAKSISTTDYDATSGMGVRFALNGSYVLDRRVFALGASEPEPQPAEIHWIKDQSGATVPVSEGAFSPSREGWHTAELYYEKDGIGNSIVKKFFVGPQLAFNPDLDVRDAVMPYGVAGRAYDATAFKPELWNKGKIADESAIRYTLTVTDPAGKKLETEGLSFTPQAKGLYQLSFYAQDPETKEFATYALKLGVFEEGKEGIAYDFEDGDISVVRSTYYHFGEVLQPKLSEEEIGGNATKKVKIEVTSETQNGKTAHEPMFYLTENNVLQNIALTESFSFDIYVEDARDRTFACVKHLYFNWNNQYQAPVNVGSLRVIVPANRWVTVTVTRADYERVLGGYIFAGSTLSLGGQMWTELDDRFVSNFCVTDATGYKEIGGINIYLDNFRVEV